MVFTGGLSSYVIENELVYMGYMFVVCDIIMGCMLYMCYNNLLKKQIKKLAENKM